MSQIRHFELLESEHQQSGRTFQKGEVVPSVHDLAKLFINKFKEVVVVAPTTTTVSAGTPVGGEGQVSTTGTPALTAMKSALGEDVTNDFPKAVEADYRVFRKGKKHFVASPDAPDTSLNKAALDKDDVDEFIVGVVSK